MSDIIFERGATENAPLLSSLPLPSRTKSNPSTFKDPNSNTNSVIVKTKFDDTHDVTTNGVFSNHNQQANGSDVDNHHRALAGTTKKSGFFSKFTGRTRYVLFMCSFANFLACCAFSLLGPFYPLEAARKGMSLTIIGFVFSVFQLVIFLASPVIGNYLTKIGAKFVYLSGIFVAGSCVILFGILDKCPSGAPFITMSIICRSVEALGCAAFMTAGFTILSNECREAVGSAFAILETANGIGYMVGPAIGGILYDLGGYGLPFYLMGTLILMNGVFIYNYLPDAENVERQRKISILSLLRSPQIVLSLVSIFVAQSTITVFDSTFARHMYTFGLSTLFIGLIFVVPPGVYAIATPVWGYVTDHQNHPKFLLVIGDLILAAAFLFIGPSDTIFPFLPNALWIIMIGLVLIGISFGMVLIPSMKLMVLGAYDLKYEPSMDTYALVSGLFNSVCSFGGFAGPMAGGVLVQEYGHRTTYTIFALISVFMMVVASVFYSVRYVIKDRERKERLNESLSLRDETEPLHHETSALIPNENDTSKVHIEYISSTSLSGVPRPLGGSISIPSV